MTNHSDLWNSLANSPFSFDIAADARLCRTNYLDDQVWKFELGSAEKPAFSLTSRYGGRVALASITPQWTYQGRVIQAAQDYAEVTRLSAFAPNYIALDTAILANVALKAEHFILDSQALAGMYTLTNRSDSSISLRLDLAGEVLVRETVQKSAIVSVEDDIPALSIAALPTICPIVLLEDASFPETLRRVAKPTIGRDITLAAGQSLSIRWVHVGLPELRDSLSRAKDWLRADWHAFIASIQEANRALPQVETGNAEWDAVLAASYHKVAQALLSPTGHFKHETFVGERSSDTGYSVRGTGADHARSWNGQDPHLAYLLLPSLATIAPHAAEGILKNYFDNQDASAFIDFKPSAVGVKSDFACLPILARLTWDIYQITQNHDFLASAFPVLLNFLNYWLAQDKNGNGYPEWADDRQTGYVAFPTFSPSRIWAQGADIRTVESPDLVAYLLSEAQTLTKMAQVLHAESALTDLAEKEQKLRQALAALWQGEHYAYRDRDTFITTSGMVLLEDGTGDVPHTLKKALIVPNRLIVKVIGGIKHTPNIKLFIEGVNAQGVAITETIESSAFVWQNRQGICTSQTAFSQVNVLRFEGLSRVYRIEARTMDTTSLDINALLPLWTGQLEKEQATSLAKLALDKKRFLRPNGITMIDATEAYFDPSNAEGAGGLWFYWQTLMGEGLLSAGYGAKITDIMKSSLKMLFVVLQSEGQFAQFYDSDYAKGLGEKGNFLGLAPLRLLDRLWGIQIASPSRVLIHKDFAWAKSITIRQHGVTVTRTTKRLKIEFASGHKVDFKEALETDQWFTDPSLAQADSSYTSIELPSAKRVQIPVIQEPDAPKRIIIDVQNED